MLPAQLPGRTFRRPAGPAADRARLHPPRPGPVAVLVLALTALLLAVPPPAGLSRPGGDPANTPVAVLGNPGGYPIYGYYEKTYELPGFDPLTGYLRNLGGGNSQIPTLANSPEQPFGVYYVDNGSDLDVLSLANSTVRHIAHIVPLYQTFASYDAMLDNEFFVEYGYDEALFFGTTTSGGTEYSLELANLTTGALQIWNTSAGVDAGNQQADYVGNNTVLVMSSNRSIRAFNLATHASWSAGSLAFFEANNVYWFPQKRQLIDVEADGSSQDEVEQLNGSLDGHGEIHFVNATTLAVDSGVDFNWVNGLDYNATTERIAFTAGFWPGPSVYTYVLAYGSNGLLSPSGEVRYTVQNATTWTPDQIEGQRYIYTSNYMLGRSYGPSAWSNATEYLFDPWNGSVLLSNRSFNEAPCPNNCFEGQYASDPNYVLDTSATLELNLPMYRVVYAYHDPASPYPSASPSVTLAPSSGPSGTLVGLSGGGFAVDTSYAYCWGSSGSGAACVPSGDFTTSPAGSIPDGVTSTWDGSTGTYLDVGPGPTGEPVVTSAAFLPTRSNLSIDPTQGLNGTNVTVNGSGLAPTTAYSACWSDRSAPVGCAGPAGFTTTSLGTAPNGTNVTWRSGDGNWLAISQGPSVENYITSVEFFPLSPGIGLLPSAGPSGTLVTLVGWGFSPTTQYGACWSSAEPPSCADLQEFITTANGTIPTGVTSTWSTGDGPWLSVTGGDPQSGLVESAQFTPTLASLSLNATGGPNGTLVGVSGSGLGANTTYAMCWAPTSAPVGCGAGESFGSTASGAVPNGTTLPWSPGDGSWLAISQGDSVANFIVSANFTPNAPGASPAALYEVAFRELGLANGTDWTVELDGSSCGGAESTIWAFLPNGTYSFQVAPLAGFTAVPALGTFTVSGADLNETIEFIPSSPAPYAVSWTEHGLPAGTNWSVTVNGRTETSTGPTIVFEEPDENLSFVVGAVAGFRPAPARGTAPLDGGPLNFSISFSAPPAASETPRTGTLVAFVLIGSIVLVAAVGLAGGNLLRRRRRPDGPKKH